METIAESKIVPSDSNFLNEDHPYTHSNIDVKTIRDQQPAPELITKSGI